MMVSITLLSYLIFRFSSKKLLIQLIGVVALSSFIQAILGIAQFIKTFPLLEPSPGITGSFFNSGPYAGFLLLGLPAVLVYFNHIKQIDQIKGNWFLAAKMKFLVLVIFIVSIGLAIIISRSRAAWLGTLICIAGYFFYENKIRIRKLWNRLSVVLRILILIGTMGSCVASALLIYNFKQGSAQGRLLIWRNTIQMICNKPISGFGVNQFQSNYMNYQAAYFQKHSESKDIQYADNTIYPFNTILKLIVEQGIPSLLPIGLILSLILFSKPNHSRYVRLTFIHMRMGLIGLLVFSLFSYPEAILAIRVNTALFLGIIAGNMKIDLRMTPLNKFGISHPYSFKLFSILLLLPVLIAFSLRTNELAKSKRNWIMALHTFDMAKPERSFQLLQYAYQTLKCNGVFCTIYGAMLQKANYPNSALLVLDKAEILLPTTNVLISQAECFLALNDLNKAEQKLRRAQKMIPSRIKPTYLLVKMYLGIHDIQNAKAEFQAYLRNRYVKRTLASYSLEFELSQDFNDYEKKQLKADSVNNFNF